MTTTIRHILTVFILASLTGCFIQTKTRKPKSDLKTQTLTVYKIDERVQVENIQITKLDTTLNLFKGESLIGITVKGTIKTVIDPELKSKYYFDKLDFVETIENFGRQITIEIIPFLKKTNPNLKKDKPTKNNVKYKQFADKTEFEFYCEKKVITPGMGKYQIGFVCGQKKETIWLFRRK